jgi:hypothetical protein
MASLESLKAKVDGMSVGITFNSSLIMLRRPTTEFDSQHCVTASKLTCNF